MNKVLAMLAAILLLPIVTSTAFAQTTYVINIPTGAADPNAPYFWQVEATGNTDGIITVKPGDSVQWENADTAAHTATSGTPIDGPDGNFDSSLFGPGKGFKHQFTEEGTFPYFCIVHPWMVGQINVAAASTGEFKIIHSVGKDVGDGKTTFDVEYKISKILTEAKVNEAQKSVTFTLAGVGTDDDKFVIKLPKGLISGKLNVWVDNMHTTNFEIVDEGVVNTLTIPLGAKSETVTVVGTAIVPEFGSIVSLILVVAIIGTIFVTTKFTKSIAPKT